VLFGFSFEDMIFELKYKNESSLYVVLFSIYVCMYLFRLIFYGDNLRF
jgi:hypothetical protein